MKIMYAVLSALKKTNAVIDKILLTICVLVFLTIILVILAGIISRSEWTPFDPLGWPEELSTFLFLVLGFLGASCCAFRRREIVVDFLLAKIPEKVLKPMNIGIKALVIVFLVMVVVAGIDMFPRILGATMALRIPRSWHFVPVIVASASMALIYLADMLELILPPIKKDEKGVESIGN